MSLYDVEFLATRVIPANSTMNIDPSRSGGTSASTPSGPPKLYATRIERNHQDLCQAEIDDARKGTPEDGRGSA
ncbi:hypothetical protein PAPYR_9690 [Paratrimastix pyriformis]|uniref:Uncharacterized protein n=1 Tax=Paratrimastix pyriformis TaxID=342808 RepID=A0ABQ8UEY9_9EUKA|nr:hypothetical protein PAPYR_9690 [Paratrimastix pyriformis]